MELVMNEQIRKLAEQSGAVTGTKLTNVTDALVLIGEEEIQAFAELIVQECVNICINENVSNIDLNIMHESSKWTVQDLATKSCGQNLAKLIKEHFGVDNEY